jgi:cytidylate kinase
MGVVTISRHYGAGGLRVSAAVADALGFKLVDRELAEEAARRLGVDPELAQARDERAPAIVEQLGLALAAGTAPFGTAPGPHLDERVVDPKTLAEATRRIIESLGVAGGYVVLGRGAQAVLAGRADACHISLVGELRDRVRRVMASQDLDDKAAERRCHDADDERAHYVRHYYGRDISDPLLYDAVLNTSRLGLDGATQIAVTVARRKLAPR